MGKKRLILGLLLGSFFIAITSVGAATCDFKNKAKLNNEVSNIKVNYEILQGEFKDAIPPDSWEDNGEPFVWKYEFIQVNILNLTENAYIEVTNDYNKDVKRYTYSDVVDGKISFETPTPDELIKYKFEIIASDVSGCGGEKLKVLNLSLPRYNEYSKYGICNLVPDYYMCQEYVTFPSTVSFGEFSNSVENEIKKKQEEEIKKNRKWYEKIGDFVVEHKTIFIAGASIIVVGGAAIVILKKRRSDEI